jgi:hypothetical protein
MGPFSDEHQVNIEHTSDIPDIFRLRCCPTYAGSGEPLD